MSVHHVERADDGRKAGSREAEGLQVDHVARHPQLGARLRPQGGERHVGARLRQAHRQRREMLLRGI